MTKKQRKLYEQADRSIQQKKDIASKLKEKQRKIEAQKKSHNK